MTTSPASCADDLVARVAGNLQRLRERIDAVRAPGQQVRIVAVTKTFPIDAVVAAQRAGLTDVGENYANELVAKRAVSPSGLCWHFLGRIQTNKARPIALHADVISSVARERELVALHRFRPDAVIDIEVDFTDRDDRGGASPDEVPQLVDLARAKGFVVRGLMTVAPQDPDAAARAFDAMARLRATVEVAELSMGMSDDLEAAVRAGSTEVRVGRGLFGPRGAAEGPLA